MRHAAALLATILLLAVVMPVAAEPQPELPAAEAVLEAETVLTEALPEALAPAPPSPLERINGYRAAAGVAPAVLNDSLVGATENHVRYYEAAGGRLWGMDLHREQPGNPEFTGASLGERARAAGYLAGTVTENAGGGGFLPAIDWYMNTINHRLPLIHPSALDIGYAFGVTQRVEWRSFGLQGPDGTPLEIATPKTDWMRAAAIVPLRPLAPGTSYTARVEAIVDGKPLAKEWSFTTR